MRNLSITKNLASFEKLSDFGVKNCFTFSNTDWGNMRISDPQSKTKYKKIFSELNYADESFIFIAPEHRDAVQEITSENLDIYKRAEHNNFQSENFNPIIVNYDAIFTKERIPIIVTPADCAIVCLTGIDRKDNKRFIAVFHAGANGTVLGLQNKVIKQLTLQYSFNINDIQVFLFPTIKSENYLKPIENHFHSNLLNNKEWRQYFVFVGNQVGFNFTQKIIDDFKKIGIEDIFETDLDTYEENKKGNLFSHTFIKQKNLPESRFGVFICL